MRCIPHTSIQQILFENKINHKKQQTYHALSGNIFKKDMKKSPSQDEKHNKKKIVFTFSTMLDTFPS